MTTTPNRFTLTLLSVALALSLTACDDKSDKKVATQVAAKVGSEEISVHQINQIVSRNNTAGVSPEAASTIPSDMPNFILRGARLATITVRRPTSVAGS